MKTKDRILEVALQQFNDKGIEQVTIRSIAGETGISAGNLAYHFKNTDAIIYALYLQLVEALGASIEAIQGRSPDIKWLYDATVYNCRIMWQYRFLLLDFVAITRRIVTIRDHFRQLMRLRQWQIKAAINEMVASGLFEPEWEEGIYDKYILRMIILSDAWISDAQVHFDGQEEEIIPFYTALILSSIQPFLTPKGRALYLEVGRTVAEYPIKTYPGEGDTED